MHVQFQCVEERFQVPYAHRQKFGDILPPYAHIKSLPTQAGASAFLTNRFPGIAAEHIAVLHLVAFRFDLLEEREDSCDPAAPVPQFIFLFRGKFVIRGVDRYPLLCGIQDNLFLEIPHNLPSPAGYRILIYGQGLVGHHQSLVYAHRLSETSADRTRSERIVEIEHPFRRMVERDAVGFEQAGERLEGVS